MRGAVSDAGGVVPGADVTLVDTGTRITRSTTTNQRGEYAFVSVEPADYRLRAALTGYKAAERDVRVGTQVFLVVDLALEPGAVEQTMTVHGGAVPLVERANASHGTVLDAASLQALPSVGRSVFLMGTSVPTLLFSSTTVFSRQQDQSSTSRLSIGGGPVRGNDYTVDGLSITDLQNRVVASPTIEALDGVNVQVHTYDAEVGRTGGGVFNITFRSGANAYHGSGFFQVRPVWAAANNYFSQRALETNGDPRNEKADTVYYMGGGGIGGPLRRGRTFFWAAAEDYHDVQTQNIARAFPTAAERSGDFSALTNTAGERVVIYDPLTHLPFPGNVIPANRIDPVAAAIMQYLPLAQANIDNGTANYNVNARIISRFQQQYTIKLEHRFTNRITVSGLYLYNRTESRARTTSNQGWMDQTALPTRMIICCGDVRRLRPSTTRGCSAITPRSRCASASRSFPTTRR